LNMRLIPAVPSSFFTLANIQLKSCTCSTELQYRLEGWNDQKLIER
jgi:hypothetical protein